jgi:hypothetical protein
MAGMMTEKKIDHPHDGRQQGDDAHPPDFQG